MAQYAEGVPAMGMAFLAVMGVTLLAAWLLRLVFNNGRRRHDAMLPPGSMGLPLLGETLEFFTRSPSLDLVPFFKRRLER